MFFTDAEKQIYIPAGSDKKYDPLALDRALRRESKNQLAKLIDTWKEVDSNEGDISEDGILQTTLASDNAEEELAIIARNVFDLPPFPECTDAVALEYLCQYLDWCKKKEMITTTMHDSTISEGLIQSYYRT